jgi:alanine racemase
LEGFLEASELPLISQHGLAVVVHHVSQLEILEQSTLANPLSAWLKVDSGMHRLGFAPHRVKAVWARLNACSNVAGPIRLMTHLANADDRQDSQTLRQVECFTKAVHGLEGERSIANSAAILAWPHTHADWVRPGLMLYGISPFSSGSSEREGLTPVMTLRSKLIAINSLSKGDAVGYGASWVCPENMRVGVAAIGYGDGYPRHATPGTPVLVNGRRVPLAGRVSMDMICLDLRAQPEAQVGDPVVLWGESLPVGEVAHHAGTISYELLCGVARRVKAIEINADEKIHGAGQAAL